MNNLKRIQEAITAAGLDALLLIDPLNRYYAAGFHTSDGAVFITPEESRYSVIVSRLTSSQNAECCSAVPAT